MTLDYTGKKFGSLTVIGLSKKKDRNRYWKSRCICGKTLLVKTSDFGPSRQRRSCGCQVKTIGERTRKHGMYQHPVHGVWMSMINRCHLKTDQAWKNYGGRGITVCKPWRKDFRIFWKDMGSTYQRGLTIERLNNNRGYSKNNCTWATRLQQNRNKRSTKR